jgi:hypothetical protein
MAASVTLELKSEHGDMEIRRMALRPISRPPRPRKLLIVKCYVPQPAERFGLMDMGRFPGTQRGLTLVRETHPITPIAVLMITSSPGPGVRR